jgi:DNA-binding LacI/PurR family transcriptional regulator
MARDLIINEHLAKRRLPDAFVVFNDTVALATIRVLNEAGLRVPEDIAVTGWDNNIFSEVAGLTTVDIAGKDMARKSVGMLFERMDGRKAESKGRSERVDLTVCLRRSSLGGAWNKIVKTHDQ